MNKIYSIGLSTTLVALLSACGSSDSDTVDQAITDAGNSASTALKGVTLEVKDDKSATNAVSSVASIGSTTAGTSPAVARLSVGYGSGNCDSGGTYNISGNQNGGTASYSNCSENGVTLNGSYTYTISETNGITTTKINANNFSITSSYNTTKLNYSLEHQEKDADSFYLVVKVNGTFETAGGPHSYKGGFENFNYTVQDKDNASIDGKFSIDMGEINSCANGIYDVKTLVTLDPTDNNPRTFDSGKMTVNGATIEFHQGGTATVTFADGNTTTVNQGAIVSCD